MIAPKKMSQTRWGGDTLLARRFWWAMMPHDDFPTILPPSDFFDGFRSCTSRFYRQRFSGR
ncbi:MAG: hypothetical protein ACXW6R_11345, partial [Candidatus Binatia bacterium]